MSILTRAMQTARDRRNHGACAFWQACDDGSGTTMTDKIGGVVETAGNVPAHDVAHTFDFGKVAGAPTSGTLPTISDQIVFVSMATVRTTSSFYNFSIGSAAADAFGIVITNAKVEVIKLGGGDNAVSTANSAGGTADQPMLSALVLKGNTLYHYRSINGGAITEVNTADATAFRALHSTLPLNNSTTICSTALVQDVHGYAVFSYTEANMPSLATIQTALAEIEANWKVGHKFLPEALL